MVIPPTSCIKHRFTWESIILNYGRNLSHFINGSCEHTLRHSTILDAMLHNFNAVILEIIIDANGANSIILSWGFINRLFQPRIESQHLLNKTQL